MSDQEPTRLVIRPRRVRWVAGTAAVVLVTVFSVVAVLLRDTPTGVYFRTSDQVAMAGLGVLLAAGALLFTRPRVVADAEGIEVRNVLTTQRFPWSMVQAVTFPSGASWGRLELPDDEYVAVMAIQSADGQYAVDSLRALRRLHREVTEDPS
ncbi:MAG TPA: PH domain-containing protein [Pseudonocardiaceae bacterium]